VRYPPAHVNPGSPALRRLARRLLHLAAGLLAAFLVVSAGAVAVYRFVDPPVTPVMLIARLEGLARGGPAGISRTWVDLPAVSPALLRSVIAAEDARFFTHPGIDLRAIEDARAWNARQRGRRLRGGSTITMQCARNVFLWQGRTYLRKALEAYFAVLLEILWGKRRILEVYVNVIELGDGVFGVEAAAERYFGKAAARLGPREAALLAAALPNPRRWNPSAPTRYLSARAASIQRRAAAVSLDSLGR
jgi:monofunctional biosynthetic peptidoglycan transglycosylase